MQHINHNLAAIRRRIMVRVWYSYLLSLVLRSAFFYGVALVGAVALFGRLTHVAAIAHNMLAVPLGVVPSFIWQTLTTALSSGEVLTVLVTLSMLALGAGALRTLHQALGPTVRVA